MKIFETPLFLKGALCSLVFIPKVWGQEIQNTPPFSSPKVKLSYQWHMHQPLYWPAPTPGKKSVQTAWDSILIKRNGGGFYPGSGIPHPENKLGEGDIGAYDPVFSKDDRVAIYQGRAFESVRNLMGEPYAGVQVSYSGSLIDNVRALGDANAYGYSPRWSEGYRLGQNSQNQAGHPRMDLVGITYHHGLAPLLPKSVLKKELALHREAQRQNFGGSPTRGFFPPELAFSEELIPELVAQGYRWTFVPAHHLARATENYLDVAPRPSSSTWNADPPNRADRRNPPVPKEQWWSQTLDGRGAILPVPFAYLPHYAEAIDPETGEASRIVVVPADDNLGYLDGYTTMGTDAIDRYIAPWHQKSSRPPLVILAHDGDNAWGGGYSYYFESVPQLAAKAREKNYEMTTVETYLAQHPTPADDLVHVEAGSWVNPEGDFGGPYFAKWLFPPVRSSQDPEFKAQDPKTFFDFEDGFSASLKSWSSIVAGAQVCEAAENALGRENTRIREIMSPVDASPAELCWHYYLAGIDSGFTYYGDSLDDEVKPGLALTSAYAEASQVLVGQVLDTTPPTIMRAQRWPHNPGGMGWGVTTRWQPVGFQGALPHSKNFVVWSLAHDLSGIKAANVMVRRDLKGRQTPERAHKLFADSEGLSTWVSWPMQKRSFAPDERGVPPQSGLNYFIKSPFLADMIWAEIKGYEGELVSYFIEVEDFSGLKTRSEIQHVWVER